MFGTAGLPHNTIRLFYFVFTENPFKVPWSKDLKASKENTFYKSKEIIFSKLIIFNLSFSERKLIQLIS